MKSYTACFFDLYGTLVDIHTNESDPAFWRKIAAYYSERGADWTGAELRGEYLRFCTEEESRLRASATPGAEVELDLTAVFAALYRARGVEPAEALIRQTALFFRKKSTTHLRAYAGARELLLGLRKGGIKVVLLSNAQSCFTRPELDELGLTDCFDRIFISSEVGRKKPDPAFYRAALEALGLEPTDCLMIGNDPCCDIQGAAAVGLDAFYIRSALSPKPAPVPEALPAVGSLPRMDLRALFRLLVKKTGRAFYE